jgi:hypothetical protein
MIITPWMNYETVVTPAPYIKQYVSCLITELPVNKNASLASKEAAT